MKEIPLTKGYFAIVDDDRYEVLIKYKWQVMITPDNIYARKGRGGNCEFMHWYVAGQPLPGYVTDHINGNGLDERASNLRPLTTRQNSSNRKDKVTCNFPGVSYDKYNGRYKVAIRVKHLRLQLGLYKDPLVAFHIYRNSMIQIDEELLPEHEKMYQNLKALNCFKDLPTATKGVSYATA